MSSTDIEAAIARADWGRALTTGLDVWRETRAPLLADVIDAIDAKIESVSISAPKADFQAVWIATARSGDNAAVGALCRTLLRSMHATSNTGGYPVRYAAWLQRVAALNDRPDDPRIASALLDAIEKAAWGTGERADAEIVVDPALRLIARIGDGRSAVRMRDLIARPVARRQVMREHLAIALPLACEAIEKRPHDASADDTWRGILESLGGVKVKESDAEEANLLALVYADPSDDAARMVLADHWLERDDPRGRFVTLQLGDADAQALAKKILREHEKAWLGELALVTKNRRWERGFLAEIELLASGTAEDSVWETAARNPNLATVTRIRKDKANEDIYLSFLFSPVLRGLREIEVISKATLLKVLAHASPFPIDHLALHFVVDPKTAALVARSDRFPSLRRITFGTKSGAGEKLMKAAQAVRAERPDLALTAEPLGWRDELGACAPFLMLGNTDVRMVEQRIALTPEGVELTCSHLGFVRTLLPELDLLRKVERVRLRLPLGVDEPQPRQGAELFDMLERFEVDADAAWSALLRGIPR